MKLTGIHQIELTSECNLRCKYCVHPNLGRPKQHMDFATWGNTKSMVKHFISKGTQMEELNLCGIGESTLHPHFCEWVIEARELVGNKRKLILATNGVGVTDQHAAAMREARMDVWVSLHRPEKAGPTVNLLRRYGVLRGVSADPSISAVNWAGQLQWEVTAKRTPCPWQRYGWGFVMSDGRVSTCCFDGQGTDGVITFVQDYPEKWDRAEIKPYGLCKDCHHDIS